mmetsp:Transcript_20710/g.55442  ORF Transcript_20710/g.55442 Transcript_20710/m.55442 type:complete len:206 (-) Transcript_20710:920-1537(-)
MPQGALETEWVKDQVLTAQGDGRHDHVVEDAPHRTQVQVLVQPTGWSCGEVGVICVRAQLSNIDRCHVQHPEGVHVPGNALPCPIKVRICLNANPIIASQQIRPSGRRRPDCGIRGLVDEQLARVVVRRPAPYATGAVAKVDEAELVGDPGLRGLPRTLEVPVGGRAELLEVELAVKIQAVVACNTENARLCHGQSVLTTNQGLE